MVHSVTLMFIAYSSLTLGVLISMVGLEKWAANSRSLGYVMLTKPLLPDHFWRPEAFLLRLAVWEEIYLTYLREGLGQVDAK